MLKIQLYITGINYFLNDITIENNYFKLLKYFTVLLFFDQTTAALVRIRDLFLKTKKKFIKKINQRYLWTLVYNISIIIYLTKEEALN